ncbi:glutamine amidotransferase [Emticicia sp. CRIBPO]|uniref:type 1 glutamine amidotransferase family protein n=1 Tax=Emticicia sp. CRIBPO TaxID=2683258 RepID=UPI0014125F5C|nr:type 1 glutamine amidotransferase family protein [Emticicia sp. CRIBPO]NBA84643.1 glutamine amidotransferase [Emticicia sp. CRIBPO]
MNIYLFLFDGFSDWEIAYLTPELHKSEKVNLITFSKDGGPVTSMGGLKILPDISIEKVIADDVSLLVLPGGEDWNERKLEFVSELTKTVHDHRKPIAAICAATTFLGSKGYLDNVKHVSNDLNYLKAVAPEYKGDALYQPEMFASDQNIITANGTAPIEFAREIFRKIELWEESEIEKWYQLFKNGIWEA